MPGNQIDPELVNLLNAWAEKTKDWDRQGCKGAAGFV